MAVLPANTDEPQPDLVEGDFRFPIDHEPVVAGDRHHAAPGNRVAVQCGCHRLREAEQIPVKIGECARGIVRTRLSNNSGIQEYRTRKKRNCRYP